MHTPHDIHHDLPSDLDSTERESLIDVATRLQSGCPNPAPTFRGDLRRKLLGSEGRQVGVLTRRRVRRLAFSYAFSGLLLLAIAAAGVAGGGPFAA